MMRNIPFLSILLFMFILVFAMPGDVRSDETLTEVENVENEAFLSDIIALEDGTVEAIISYPEEGAPIAFADERVVTTEDEAKERIESTLEEISQLEDRSDEGELQKEIEKIKLDAEIARFEIYASDAEDEQDIDLAYKARDEIDHLENLDQPVIGVPEEQPVPQTKKGKKKGGRK